MSAKPSLLIYGNCQGEHIAHIARQLTDVRERFDVKVIPLQQVTEADWQTRYNETFFANVRVLWNQVETGDPSPHRLTLRDRLPPGCQTVNFPPLMLLCLWPFSGADPRIAAGGDYVYPWADSIAASLAPSVTGEDKPDDLLFAEYLRLSTEKMPDLERRLRLDATCGRAADALADIAMWDWMEARLRTTPLFHTATHLTASPLAHLVPRLLGLTGALSASQIAGAQREAAFLMRGNRGQDIEAVPVHPLVAERLGLRWYDPDSRHRWHSHLWTYREYVLNYIRWEPFMP